MPSSIAPSTQSNSEDSPASCPAVRGSPRCLAQRPLPSMTIATCRGHLVRPGSPAAGRRTGAGSARLTCAALTTRSTSASDRSPRSRCHCSSAATSPLPSRRLRALAGLGAVPVAGQQRLEQLDGHRAGHRRPGRPAGAGRPMPPAGTEKCRCGPSSPQRAQSRQRRLPAGHRHRAQQEGVEHQAGRVGAVGQRAHRADDQQEEPQRRLLLLRRSAGRRSPAPRCRRCSRGSRRRRRCRRSGWTPPG